MNGRPGSPAFWMILRLLVVLILLTVVVLYLHQPDPVAIIELRVA